MPYNPYSGGGRRFGVGVQTPGGALGFNLTPVEASHARKRKLAAELGLQDMPGVENLDEKGIVGLGVQQQGLRQRDEERRGLFAQEQAQKQYEMQQKEQARQQKVEALVGMATKRFSGKMTPVEIDQLLQYDPDVVERMYFGDWQNQQNEERQKIAQAAKVKQAEAWAQQYQDPEDRAAAVQMAVENVPPSQIEVHMKQRVKDREAQQQQTMAAEKAQKYMDVQTTEGRAIYEKHFGIDGDPDKALKATQAELNDAAKAKRDEEREKRMMDREDREANVKLGMLQADMAEGKMRNAQQMLKEAQGSLEADTPAGMSAIQKAQQDLVQAQAEKDQAMQFLLQLRRQAAGTGKVQGEAGLAGGIGAQMAPTGPAVAPPPQDGRIAAAPVRHEETRKATLSLPPQLVDQVAQTKRALSENPQRSADSRRSSRP